MNNFDNKIEIKEINEDEIQFFTAVKSSIDKMVYDEVNQYSKLNMPIDPKSIEERTEKRFFKNLEREMTKTANEFKEFSSLLKMDQPILHEKIIQLFREKFKSEEELNEQIQNCKHLKDFESLVTKLMNAEEEVEIYRLGEHWFNQAHYKNSKLYFSFLTSLNSKNRDYWLAKGVSEYYDQQYEEALISYSIVIQLDSTMFIAYIHIIDALLALSKFSEAEQIYNTFINEIDKSDYEKNEYIMDKLNYFKDKIINKI